MASAASIEEALDLAMEYAAREFADPELLRAEYELILYATRAPRLRDALLAWQRSIESMVGEVLERLGVARPLQAARTLMSLLRAFELERLVRPELELDELRARLELVARSLTTEGGKGPSARSRNQ